MDNSAKRAARSIAIAAPKQITRSAATLLLGAASYLGIAGAQERDDASAPTEPTAQARMIDTVIVTARRREEDLQSVPASVTAINSETLDNLRLENIEDLQSIEPTLSVSSSSGNHALPVFSIRGIRPTEAIYGQDPTVAVYLAEVVQSPAQGSNLGMWDLQNVQILKGPQGTLFGRNTVGGAILLTARKPGDEFASDIMVGFGSYDLIEGQLGVDMPFSDSFRARLAGRLIDGGDYQKNVAPGPEFDKELGGEKTQSVRLTAVWDVTDSVENTTTVTYDNKETNGRGMVLQAVNPTNAFTRCYDGPTNPNGRCPQEPLSNPLPDFAGAVTRAQGRDVNDVEFDGANNDEVSAWSVINTTTAKFSALTFKSIAAYREVETELSADTDASPVPDILQLINQESNLDHGSVELQLLGSAFEDRLDWVTGLYYYHEEGAEDSPGNFFKALLPISPIMQGADVDNSSYSAFAQGSFKLAPRLTFTAGGRYTVDEKEMTLRNATPLSCSLVVDNGTGGTVRLPQDACRLTLSDDFSQPTGTVALDFQITPDVLLYVTSRLGYRSGGFNLRADVPAEYAPFDPETVVDLEVGTKADWSIGDWRMRSNIAIFYQWYDDIQRTVAVPNVGGSPGSAVLNAAKANVFGIELQQTIQPTDNLTLQLNYFYNDPEYDSWMDPVSGTDLSSTPFFFTPTHSGSAMVRYEVPLSEDLGTVQFTANGAYTGDIWINALHTITDINLHPASVLPLLKQADYWLLDLSLGWREISGSNLDVSAYVRNATDEEYKVGGLQLYAGATGYISAAYGAPRTYGAQLRYRF